MVGPRGLNGAAQAFDLPIMSRMYSDEFGRQAEENIWIFSDWLGGDAETEPMPKLLEVGFGTGSQ